MSSGLAVQAAMREALLAHHALGAILGGAHIYDELPRGAKSPYVNFAGIETRDWSVMDAKAHEHFITIDIATNERSRGLAHAIAHEIELALDQMPLALSGHRLVNLRLVMGSISRHRNSENFGGTLRFRAATEPL